VPGFELGSELTIFYTICGCVWLTLLMSKGGNYGGIIFPIRCSVYLMSEGHFSVNSLLPFLVYSTATPLQVRVFTGDTWPLLRRKSQLSTLLSANFLVKRRIGYTPWSYLGLSFTYLPNSHRIGPSGDRYWLFNRKVETNPIPTHSNLSIILGILEGGFSSHGASRQIS